MSRPTGRDDATIAGITATADRLPPPVRLCRMTGAAGLVVLVSTVTALLVAAREDVNTQAALHAYLERTGGRLFLAWILLVISGLAWLGFIVGMRRMLPSGGARDLFVAAAVAAQAVGWAGTSLDTAAAAPNARDVPLSVFNAFREAAHLAGSAGTAATGVALVALAVAASDTPLLPRLFLRLTRGAGVVLVLAAVIGPVSLPVTVLWLLAVSTALLRMPTSGRTRRPQSASSA